MKHWSDKLKKLHACLEAVEWARTQKSLAVAWKTCERGDWMLWLLVVSCKTDKEYKLFLQHVNALGLLYGLSRAETAAGAAEHKKCADIIRRYFLKAPNL